MEKLIEAAAQFGPWWLLVFALIFILWHFVGLWFDVYSDRVKKTMELEEKRELRKSEESKAREIHEKEMAEIKGQMVVAIQDSNNLMAALKTLMESVQTSNKVLHEDLLRSQEGSKRMQQDMHAIGQKVDVIYQREL